MTDYPRWISANALRQLLDSSADTKHHLPAGPLDICGVRLGNADPSPAEGHYVLLTFTNETQLGTAFTPRQG